MSPGRCLLLNAKVRCSHYSSHDPRSRGAPFLAPPGHPRLAHLGLQPNPPLCLRELYHSFSTDEPGRARAGGPRDSAASAGGASATPHPLARVHKRWEIARLASDTTELDGRPAPEKVLPSVLGYQRSTWGGNPANPYDTKRSGSPGSM